MPKKSMPPRNGNVQGFGGADHIGICFQPIPRRGNASTFRRLKKADPDVLAEDIDGDQSVTIDERYGYPLEEQ